MINMLIDNKPSSEWKHYSRAIKYYCEGDFSKAKSQIERGLKSNMKNRSLFYLLLSLKLLVSTGQNDKLYNRLRREFGRIPVRVRPEVVWALINYHSIYHTERELKAFRVWSERYEQENTATIMLFLGKARKEALDNNKENALKLFEKTYELAKKLEDPQGLINVLNDFSWYLKLDTKERALKLAEKASYYSGYYDEDLAAAPYVLDTLATIQFENHVISLYKTAEIQRFVGFRNSSTSTILKKKSPVFNPRRSKYANNELIRDYLKNRMNNLLAVSRNTGIAWDNLSKLINGKTQTVRGETLRKIITGLKIEVDPLNDPYPIVNEWIKLQIDKGFENAITELEKLKPSEREILILSTYTALLNRRKDYPYLSRKGTLSRALELCKEDLRRFREFTENRYETKKFVAQLFELHPFLEGRRDLVWKFLKALPARKRKEFIHKYLELGDKDRGVIDTFMRNYVRYDRNWGLRLKPPAELYPFTQKYRLKKTQTALAYWALDKKKEREKLRTLLCSGCESLRD
ncbi:MULTISPECIES: helix-turn-helix transcriptional regulator [Kosmotoga]|nr:MULTISPECIES: helix-turn-helix transcriptional regulator [Kosmotoga]